MRKLLVLILVLTLFLTGCSSSTDTISSVNDSTDSQPESSPLNSEEIDSKQVSLLFANIYYPLVTREVSHDKVLVLEFLETQPYKFEETDGYDGLKILNSSDNLDYVHIAFSPERKSSSIMSLSYYLNEKDIEVSFSNSSSDGDSSYDKLFTHIVGESQKDVENINEQIDFLLTSENEKNQFQELDEPIELQLDINHSIKNGQLSIHLETNLPNNTTGMVTVSNDYNNYKAQDHFTVENGVSEIGPFSNNGKTLEKGDYIVSISTPLAQIQSDDVYYEVGEEYLNYTGEQFDEEGIGRTIHYQIEIEVE